jgi:meso-butanediol dehydrogenase/(S,S)-butanediol dehydrogenase/diacetyl reductase
MDLNLKDKVILVTGGADGIGYCVAQLLASEGSKVVIADINAEKGKAASDELNKEGGNTIAVKVDVQDEDSVKAMVKTTLDTFGRVDALINFNSYRIAPFLVKFIACRFAFLCVNIGNNNF